MALPTKFDGSYVPVYGSHETEQREWAAIGIGTGALAWVGFGWMIHLYSRLMYSFNRGDLNVTSNETALVMLAAIFIAIIGTGIIAAGLVCALQMPKWWEEQAKRRALEVREIDYDYLAKDIQATLVAIAGKAKATFTYVVGDRDVTTVRFPKAWYEKRKADGTCVINTALAVQVRVPRGTTVAQWLRLEGGADAVERTDEVAEIEA
jgi:hypothetical protein